MRVSINEYQIKAMDEYFYRVDCIYPREAGGTVLLPWGYGIEKSHLVVKGLRTRDYNSEATIKIYPDGTIKEMKN